MNEYYITIAYLEDTNEVVNLGTICGEDALGRAKCGAEVYFKSWKQIKAISVYNIMDRWNKLFELKR